MKRNLLLASALVGAFAASGATAVAGESDAAREAVRDAAVRVSYADLDLSNARDSAVMLRRLHDAALEVCGASVWSVKPYKWAVERSDCYNASMARAVSDLHSSALSRLLGGRADLARN